MASARYLRILMMAAAAVGVGAQSTALASSCEKETTIRDVQAAIDVYSTYGAQVDFNPDDLRLRALAVENAIDCLRTRLTPQDAAEIHRYHALRYYLDRPPELDGRLDTWDKQHLDAFGRILDAACKAQGGPQGLGSEAWDGTNIDNMLRQHTCPTLTDPVIPRPARGVVLVDGRLPETVLSPRRAPATTAIPAVVQRFNPAGEVLSTTRIGAGAAWPSYALRARQTEPLVMIGVGSTLVAAGVASMVAGGLARDQFCSWRYGGWPTSTRDDVLEACEELGEDVQASNGLIFGGLGGVLLGGGLIAGGSVWLHTQPDGATVGITRPLK